MSFDDHFTDVRKTVDWVYLQLAERPQIFAGRVGNVEAYIVATENMLNAIAGDDRSDKYSAFLAEKRFGARGVLGTFEAQNACRQGFISVEREDVVEYAVQLEELFLDEFMRHWAEFLVWRGRATDQREIKAE